MRDPESRESSLEARQEALVDRPQRWILPTMWWWNRRENWRLIVKPYIVAMWVIMAILFALDLPWWVGGALTGALLLVLLGLIERGIRHAAARRSLETRASETNLPPLPPSASTDAGRGYGGEDPGSRRSS